MAAALPATKPRVSRTQLMEIIRQRHPDFRPGDLTIVGVRGYYRDTMGAVGRNDRAMYDDALFIVTPDAFVAFNGNTDPNGYRKGAGRGAGKGMASLKPGVWPAYRLDLHQGKYLAVCQRSRPVTVTRDGSPPYDDTGMFGINIHKGGINGTSSEGCQTVPPAQWPAFIALVIDQAKRVSGAAWREQPITYVLLDGVPG